MVVDHIARRDVGEHRRCDAPLAVLLRGDDRVGGGPPLADYVDLQFDGPGPDHDGAGEHRGYRTHRLLREPFGHSDNRLGEHLRALHHLPLILPGGSRLGGEAVLSILLHVAQVEQALNGPRLR